MNLDDGSKTRSPAPRRLIDWEAIEREYRAGQVTVVEIGRQHGLSHTAINKRAKRDGWTRNLADRVRKKVSARSAQVSPPPIELAAIEPEVARGVEVVREPQGQHRQNEMRRFTIELRETGIEALVRLRFLPLEKRHDREAVKAALYKFFDLKLGTA
jgi:hypothetical protein